MSEDVRKHVGELLRELRMARGLTLSQVQELTRQIDWPVSRSRLSLLERGEVDVHLADLYPLSRTYGFAIGALISEAVVAHSKKKFAKGLDAKELFEKAKELFRVGNPLEAAWAFDEAGRRAADGDPDFRYLCMISAGHCYERVGALELALSRVESVVDHANEGSDSHARALAKAAALLASIGSFGRARLYNEQIDRILKRRINSDLRAYLEGVKAKVLFEMGLTDEASRLAELSGKRYIRLGSPDMAAKMLAVSARFLLQTGTPRKKRALRLVLSARNYLSEESEIETRLRVLISLGETLLANDRAEEAQEPLRNALRIASSLGYETESSWALSVLESTAVHLGDTKQASKWNKNRAALRNVLPADEEREFWRSRWGRRA